MKAAVQLGLSTKVINIITLNNETIESFITNNSAVKRNITNVNGSTPQTPNMGSGNNGSGSTSTPPPRVEIPTNKTVMGKVTAIDGASVVINSTKYSIAENVKSFFTANELIS